MKIKLNTKRYPFHKELVELAVSNGNKVFYKEADGSLSRVRKSGDGYQVCGGYYVSLLTGKYIIKAALPVEVSYYTPNTNSGFVSGAVH
ncbi:MAG TPA: hypothetical protein PKC44_07270 [Agitococcus sp.]|nr:hypothetical protein [Agitococcus sp.]